MYMFVLLTIQHLIVPATKWQPYSYKFYVRIQLNLVTFYIRIVQKCIVEVSKYPET